MVVVFGILSSSSSFFGFSMSCALAVRSWLAAAEEKEILHREMPRYLTLRASRVHEKDDLRYTKSHLLGYEPSELRLGLVSVEGYQEAKSTPPVYQCNVRASIPTPLLETVASSATAWSDLPSCLWRHSTQAQENRYQVMLTLH